MTFNLVDDPWIIVRQIDGDEATVGLRELFHRSREIVRIQGDLPTQDFAVLRLALAVYYRVALETAGGDYSEVDVERLWRDGPPLSEIDRYLTKWHDRFELEHPDHPFLQVPDLRLDSGDVRGLELLVPDCPGTSSLFTMRQEVPALSDAAAARWLVHCQAFDYSGIKSGAVGDPRVKGGRGYPLGIGWAGWLGGIVLEGAVLSETLVHNFVAPKEPDDQDLPLWELAPLTAKARPERSAGPFGPMGLFTWPIRRLRLFRTDGVVSGVLICNGDPIDYWNQHTREPLTGWRLSDAQRKKHKSSTAVYMPMAHDPARAMWRGLGRLLPPGSNTARDKSGDQFHLPPRTLEALARRVQEDLIPESTRVHTTGVGMEYGAQMSSYRELFSDSLTFHSKVAVPESPSHQSVLAALARADGGAAAIGGLGGDLAVAAGGERDAAAGAARNSAYDALGRLFRTWVASVTDSDAEQRLAAWTNAAREALIAIGDDLVSEAPPAARALRERDGRPISTGTAQNRFYRNLDQHLPYQPPHDAAADPVTAGGASDE